MKKIVLLTFCTVILNTGWLFAQNLTVASYNIRYENRGDSVAGNGWGNRLPVITGIIRFNDFDVFGAQEVLHHQLTGLLAGLPGYGSVGVGRDDGKEKGEYAPIFFKKERLALLKSGHFWLSTITDRPNKGWDAVLPRICTWAQFKDKNSDQKFWFFNLHMDHVGVEARKESAKLVLQKIKEMCGNESVILTGDFNVDQTHESYAVLNTSGILKDSYDLAQIRYALNGTFNSFNPNLKTDSRIDHIFVSRKIAVERYGVLTDTYRSSSKAPETVASSNFPKEVSLQNNQARVPSDHFPVKVVLILGK